MRFCLRCIFVLSIVYGAILRHDGLLPEWSAPVARALPEAEASAERRLAAGVGTFCGRDPASCLAGAAKLGRLLAAAPDAASRQRRAWADAREQTRGAIGQVSP